MLVRNYRYYRSKGKMAKKLPKVLTGKEQKPFLDQFSIRY